MRLLRETIRTILVESLESVYYHGRGGPASFADDKPAFFTEDLEDAEWYAYSRGSGEPMIHVARLAFSKPASLKDLRRVVDDLGLDEKTLDMHTPNMGANNLNDYVYVPEVRSALEAEGFDAVRSLDVLGNDEVPIVIVWHANQIHLQSSTPVRRR